MSTLSNLLYVTLQDLTRSLIMYGNRITRVNYGKISSINMNRKSSDHYGYAISPVIQGNVHIANIHRLNCPYSVLHSVLDSIK